VNDVHVFVYFHLDYDTDEETDKLLGLEHRIHAKNQAVRDAVRKRSSIALNERYRSI
jgi:hypothetical protein